MLIFIISIIALGLGVVLMKEYGWADLTGNTRNDLVFEKRNKNYGAYEIRQKYSNRLLVSFVAMLGFISIAAVSPKFFKSSNPIVQEDGKKLNEDREITNVKEEKEKEKEKEKPLENKQIEKPQPPAGTPTDVKPNPIASDTKQKIDSTKNENALIAKEKSKGDSTATVYHPPIKNPGKCLDCERDSIKAIVHPPSGVDEQASFDYISWVKKHLKVPEGLAERGVKSGKIYISFIVDEEGNISSAKIKKGIYDELDKDARRVISSMPKWKPAKLKGEPVKVNMVVPINIVLN